jgi:transcriptional regulator of arginine metabolism
MLHWAGKGPDPYAAEEPANDAKEHKQ